MNEETATSIVLVAAFIGICFLFTQARGCVMASDANTTTRMKICVESGGDWVQMNCIKRGRQ